MGPRPCTSLPYAGPAEHRAAMRVGNAYNELGKVIMADGSWQSVIRRDLFMCMCEHTCHVCSDCNCYSSMCVMFVCLVGS